MSITIEPTKPRICHDERFLNLWIKVHTFTLDYVTDLSHFVKRNHFQSTLDDKAATIIFLYTPPAALFSVYNGKVVLLAPPFPSEERPVHTYTTQLAWRLLAT